MRIIGGRHKRRTLKEVPSHTTRSTKDRVKETIFNMIAPALHGGRVLDLFAGSGALGIEAISRGATFADFVEKDKTAFNVLKDNIMRLEMENEVMLHFKDALATLQSFKEPFDVILLDPPYESDLLAAVLPKIAENRLLSEDGVIVILCGKNESFPIPDAFQIKKDKTIGITDLKLLTWSDQS